MQQLRDSCVEHQLLADAARTLNGKQVALLEVKLQDHPVKPVRDHLLFASIGHQNDLCTCHGKAFHTHDTIQFTLGTKLGPHQ